MKKIIGITSIRSDYDLMSGLYKRLMDDKEIELRLLVSGAHLSKTYGYSVELIEKDGLPILAKLETLIDSDSMQSRLKTASLLLQNSIDIVAQYNPDLIMYVGDREDVLIGAMLGAYLEIPTAHFSGGDHVKDGHVDNPVRHATSKLSTIHFVSLEEHKNRLLRMGEPAERIYRIGNMALDAFNSHLPISNNNIRSRFGIDNDFDEYALVIFHPVSSEKEKANIYFSNILKCLKELNINAFVSYPNTDPYNKSIIEVIEKNKADNNYVFYKNLDRDLFLSIYKNCQFIIGNLPPAYASRLLSCPGH